MTARRPPASESGIRGGLHRHGRGDCGTVEGTASAPESAARREIGSTESNNVTNPGPETYCYTNSLAGKIPETLRTY
jgi:hypothetical protein